MANPDPTPDVTQLIRLWGTGDRDAGEKLFHIVLPELRAIAGGLMRRERTDHTLQPTALVNEIYFRLSRARKLEWQDRKHFFAIAARAMRHCLIDHAKSHPDILFQPLDESLFRAPSPQIDSDFEIGLSLMVDRLAEVNPQFATIVEYKYYLGLTDEEAAELMELGIRTFKRRWREAREWLFEQSRGGQRAALS